MSDITMPRIRRIAIICQIFFNILRDNIGVLYYKYALRFMLNRLLQSKLFLLFEIIVLCATIAGFVKISKKKAAIQLEITYLSKQIALEKEKQLDLFDRYKKSVRSKERELEAKRKLNYRRPGETVFVFYEENLTKEAVGAGPVTSDNASNEEASNVRMWWRYFFK